MCVRMHVLADGKENEMNVYLMMMTAVARAATAQHQEAEAEAGGRRAVD